MKWQDAVATFGVSETVARVYEALEVMAVEDDENGYVLLWLIDALVSPVEQLESYVRYSNGRDGWANMMDPATVVDDAIIWLGQFVGVEVDPSNRVTPRNQVMNHVRWGRGSVPAIMAQVQPFVLSGRTPYIEERTKIVAGVTTSNKPWDYTIVVHQDDVGLARYAEFDARYASYTAMDAAFATYGAMLPDLTDLAAIVQATKPGGDLAWLYIAPLVSYFDFYPDWDGMPPWPTYAALDAAFATYAAMDAYNPP